MKYPPRKGIALCLALLLTGSLLSANTSAAFADVPRDHWAYQSIHSMEKRGLIQGSYGYFRPGESVSNQAFLAMVCRAVGLDDRKLETPWTPEPILAFGQYFNWFRAGELPEADRTSPITREFAAQLLVNSLFPEAVNPEERSLPFSDISDITEKRLPYVEAAVRLGLMGGYEDGTFRPQADLTRAAAAEILQRALAQTETTNTIPVDSGSVQVPILMYHDVSYLGRGYSKTPEVFRKQMQELKDAGFETVFFSQLIDYVDKGVPLPEKPIVITFDDGYESNYTYVLPILRELNMKAEISIIGNAMDYTDWGMKWTQVQEMQNSGLVHFQAHTSGLHDAQGRTGVLKMKNESWVSYVLTFGSDTRNIRKVLETQTGTPPQVFTYPLGKYNPMTEAIVKRLGFRASLTTLDGIVKLKQGDPQRLYQMNRVSMDFRNGSVLKLLKKFGYT